MTRENEQFDDTNIGHEFSQESYRQRFNRLEKSFLAQLWRDGGIETFVRVSKVIMTLQISQTGSNIPNAYLIQTCDKSTGDLSFVVHGIHAERLYERYLSAKKDMRFGLRYKSRLEKMAARLLAFDGTSIEEEKVKKI